MNRCAQVLAQYEAMANNFVSKDESVGELVAILLKEYLLLLSEWRMRGELTRLPVEYSRASLIYNYMKRLVAGEVPQDTLPMAGFPWIRRRKSS